MENQKQKSVLDWINMVIRCIFILYILKNMALYQASGFTGFSDSHAVPAGSSDVIFTGSVGFILSTGTTQQVFDTLSAALKCIHFMESNKIIFAIT